MSRLVILLLLAAGAWAQGLKEFSIELVDSSGSHHNRLDAAEIDADRIGLRDLIGYAHGLPSVCVLGPGWLDDRFSVKAKAREGQEDQFLPAFQKALAERLHLRTERTTKELPVYILKVVQPDSPKLHAGNGHATMRGSDGSLSVVNVAISDLESFLMRNFGRPIIDQTGLKGRYSFDLEWQAGDVQSLAKTIREQLGLELAEDRRKIDVLTVDRSQKP